MQDIDLGIVTSPYHGWATVRKRWEEDLADYAGSFHNIEDHAPWVTRLTTHYGGGSIGRALAGRAASHAAIGAGAKVVLLTALANAPLVPLPRGVTYLVYGDCTNAQIANLYWGTELRFPGSWVSTCIRRLVNHGCYFLCMSEWYRDALREEWGISEDRLVLLPFYVDTDKWKPLDPKPVKARSQVVFIGGELHRKGGHIVYELAQLEKFKNVDFHVVSPNAEEGPENLRVHRFLRPDSDELIRLTAECDIFVLPTRADASPNAPLEAAACGIPAIITRRGGIAEIVIDGLTGSVLREPTLDSFAEELSIYLSNPELVAQRGRNARQHVERNYSKTRHFTILRNVINRAAAEVNGYVLPRLRTLPVRNSTGDVGGRRV